MLSVTKPFRKLSVTKRTPNFREAVNILCLPLRKPAPDEVVIKVLYVGINACDIVVSAGGWSQDGGKTPFDIGLEALGIVIAVGENVKNLQSGQTALCWSLSYRKAYSEYVYATSEEVIAVPDLKPEYIALLVSGLTAAICLDTVALLMPKETILITAAAGGLGHLAVQWAKRKKNAHVIALCSNEDKAQFLHDLACCDLIINYKDEDVNAILSQRYPHGIDVIWETVGGSMLKKLAPHLAPNGRLVSLGAVCTYKMPEQVDAVVSLPKNFLIDGRKMLYFSLARQSHHYEEYFKQLYSMLVNGQIKVACDYGHASPDGVFTGLLGVVRAVEWLQSGQSYGKVIATVQSPQ